MSPETPERLQTFRDENANEPGSGRMAAALAFGVMFGAAAAGTVFYTLSDRILGVPPTESADRYRDLAVMYEAKDLPEAAIESHVAYLKSAQLPDAQRGEVAFSIAKLAFDQGDHEQALKYLYESEYLAPNANIKDDRSNLIVESLENLGRSADLRRELKQRTDPRAADAAAEAGAVVLASFGDETITDRDLERALNEMPAAARQQLASPEQREALLKNLVAERLLLDKAFRMGLDEDPELQASLESTRDSLMVRKLMEVEVAENVTVTPQDVERFYQAELERFTRPATVSVVTASADTAEAAAAITEFSGRPVFARSDGRIGELPPSPEAVETINETEVGETTPPIEIEGAFHVFKVVDKTAEDVAPLEQVREQAESMLRATKEREHIQQLVDETLRVRDVELYPERLQPGSARQ
jgi:peptidyl-prolyl cis-trans isomerase C